MVSAAARGITPPSPSPAKNRSSANSSGPEAAAVIAMRAEKNATVARNIVRRPKRAAALPTSMAPSSIPISGTEPRSPAVAGSRFHSSRKEDRVAP